MFNIIYSPLLNTLLCVGVVIIVFLNYGNVFSNRQKGGTSYFTFWLFITLFAMFYCPEYGDSFNGSIDLAEYAATGIKGHYEDLYYLPLRFLPNNYYVWRFCVWGLAAFLLTVCYKTLNCPSQYATVIFLTVTLIPCFYYLRNSLGFALLYLAVILLLKEKQQTKLTFKTILVSILLLVISFFAHNSMPVYYLVVLLAFFCPFNYWTIIISVLLYPFLHRFVPDFATAFLSQSYISDATSELGLGYLSRDNTVNYNINGFILLVLQFIPFFVVYFDALKKMKRDDNNYTINKVFFQISYILLYIALCFYQTASNHLFLRFINTCTLPMALVLVFYMFDKRSTKINKIFIGSIALYYLAYSIGFLI